MEELCGTLYMLFKKSFLANDLVTSLTYLLKKKFSHLLTNPSHLSGPY